MDYWLLNLWIRKGQPDIRYIPASYLLPHGQPEDAHSISIFRDRFDLPVDGPCPHQWVIGFTNIGGQEGTGGNHYCTMLFMPTEKEIHVLGKRYAEASQIRQPPDWHSWGGSNIWRKVATLHGWDLGQRMIIRELNWVQNGYDCGATVCQITDVIWSEGFRLRYGRFWRKPTLQCCHGLRKRMAGDIHQMVLTNIDQFNALVNAYGQDVLDDLFTSSLNESIEQVTAVQRELHPNPGPVLQNILNLLNQSMRACRSCNQVHAPSRAPQNPPQPGVRHKPRPGGESPDGTRSSDEEDEGRGGQVCPDAAQSAVNINRPFHVKDWSSAVMGRFPRPTPPPHLPPLATLRGLRIPSDADYDEYETGPTLEALDPIPDTLIPLGEINLVYLAGCMIANPWVTFRDYGYRIDPDFAQSFYLPPPIMVKEHVMPVGLSPLDTDDDSEVTLQSRRGDTTDFHDLEVLGAEDLISRARVAKCNDILLTGKTPDGKFIKLDLERDAVMPMVIRKAVDIDSVIWVTRYPRFNRAINIFSNPIIRNRPPIFKHNHVYVDLLIPQSVADRADFGPRNEWWSKTFKLFQIPHLQLGRMGDGAGSVNLFLAFPRMTHKHPYVPRWVNVILSDVQNIFWDQVILPAMHAVTPEVIHPYVGLDRAHLAFKENQKGASKSMSSFPFRKQEFVALADKFREIVSLARLNRISISCFT
jgi:hypothetical protein